ncbi:MAG: LysM peptidoglycan-binding domain-containing protein [Gammaproteobacteria bacterium]|jgi:hypothetical protein|nr:LysM peptidoglycan-binding domain-containing protein [Gammaproteobacteria bacterium]MBQ0775241.1 LysM peptidoglycan-binding domain-containing protein [Gammaproteobacteria bacterium]
MMKSLLRTLIAFSLVSTASLAAAEVDLKNGHPNVYYVKQGDTLWEISNTFLDSPWEWPELWHVNQEIENPHLIYPGDVIRLVYVDGKPQLQLERGSEPEQVKMMADGSLVKLKPKARVVALDTAIPTIPLDSIQNFLLDALVLTSEEIDAAPYVISGQDRRVIFGKDDTVYARDAATSWETLNQGYGFYRVGERYVDPETKETLGYEALQIGTGKVTAHENEIITLYVINSRESIRAEDRVMTARERRMMSTFLPSSPDTQIDARVIRFFGRLNSVALNDVVVLNKGARDGLKEGNVLDIRQRGDSVLDSISGQRVQMPAVTAGTMIVFRTFEKVAYGLIIRATLPIYPNDIATNPQ